MACAMVVADVPPAYSDDAVTADSTSSSSGDEQSISPVTGELTAPDRFSAQLLAKLRGERVEDLSQRSEVGSTFALPDGQWQQVVASGPVWVQIGGDGTTNADWVAVDETLEQRSDGSFSPVAHYGEVIVSGGEAAGEDAETVVASVQDPATGLVSELTWSGDLPTPSVVGPRATFTDVQPSMDMVVQVTGSGVEQFFVLKDPPATDEELSLPVSVGAEGATSRDSGGGSVELVSNDDVVARVAAPAMWDAAADVQRGNPVLEEWDVGAQPSLWALSETKIPDSQDDPVQNDDKNDAETDPGTDAALGITAPIDVSVDVSEDEARLVLEPSQEFLHSKDVTYPVVIDPSVSIGVGFDTFVQSGVTGDYSADPELLAGTFDGGKTISRSILGFGTSSVKGMKVTSAQVNLWESWSYSCNARPWDLWAVSAASTATKWTNQPTWYSKYSSSTATRGYSSACSAGWVSVDASTWAQAALNNNDAVNWVGLRAANEKDSYGWKRFNSGNAASGRPTLSVTYNSYPNRPGNTKIPQGQYNWWTDNSGVKTLYVNSARPMFSSVVSDPDGGSIKARFSLAQGSTTVWDKAAGASVSSGGSSTLSPSSSLPALKDGQAYSLSVWADDGALLSKDAYKPWSFVVDLTPPAKPSLTASNYQGGQWLDSAPSSNNFTMSSVSQDAVSFQYKRDGDSSWTTLAAAGQPATASLDWNPGAGSHRLQVQAVDRAGLASETASFSFGSGGAALTSPQVGLKSTDAFQVAASAPAAGSGSVTPTVYWRTAGTSNGTGYDPASGSNSGWTEGSKLATIAANKPVSISTTLSGASAASSIGKERVPLSLDVQVCFEYSDSGLTRCTWNEDQGALRPTVVRVPHAFGDNFPTAEAGPGQVALWTGEFNMSASDVSVPGYVGDLSVSRSYSTLAGKATNPVFGPGWSASFDGTDAGAAGATIVDNTLVDGTYSLTDAENDVVVYRQPSGGKKLMEEGVYLPVDEETSEAGMSLTLSGKGGAAQLILREEDGTTTVYTPVSFTAGKAPTWAPSSVIEPGSAGATTFTRDNAGRITRILAPVPPGVDCSSGALGVGCRALNISYASATTATATNAGDITGQVRAIDYVAWDPATSAMASTPVATYLYDVEERLVKVTDPRTGLATSYGYEGSSASEQPLLRSVTPSGLAGFALDFGQASQDKQSLLSVSRDPATAGGAKHTLSRFVYGIDPQTVTQGLPTLTSEEVAVWGQSTAPTYAAAVFSADRQNVAGSTPSAVTAGDWPYADVQYTDDQGRVLNTASYGAGDWQFTATGYDNAGRVIRSLDQKATADIRNQYASGGTLLSQEVLDSYATLTRYNTDVVSAAAASGPGETTVAAGTVITPAGSLVTDTWGPAFEASDGNLVRTHTHMDYDQDAPNQGVNPKTGLGFRLATTTTVSAADALSGSPDPAVPLAGGEEVLSRSISGYAPMDGTDLLSETSGWVLGSGTTSTTVTDLASNAGPTTLTKYDTEGRVLESRTAASNGTDAGTTLSAYYTAAAQTGPASGCGSRPEWAGLACRTWSPDASEPVTTTTYSRYLAPATVTESTPSASRTTTTTFDEAGRVLTSSTAATGLAGSTSLPTTRTSYDPSTGLTTAVSSLDAAGATASSIATGYDGWGREVTYTDRDRQTTTTVYDDTGRVATVTDPQGTTTNTYDSDTDHRGLLTKLDVSGTGSYTAAYDAAGNMITQTMPGGITQTSTYDRAGNETSLNYSLKHGDAAPIQIATWSIARDHAGRINTLSGPERDSAYTYDLTGRLATGSGTLDGTCTTRTYGFDTNSNRTNMSASTRVGSCDGDSVEETDKQWAYDAGNRVQNGANGSGGYMYDAFGRQTSIPAADTVNGSNAGDAQVSYYDNDLVASATQNGSVTTYSLDPVERRAEQVTTTGGQTKRVVRHYTDSSDNPGWATLVSDGTTAVTRYSASIGGDLSASLTDGVVTLEIVDPIGNIATSVIVDSEIVTPKPLNHWDEYGNQIKPVVPVAGPIAYGWLGGKERAVEPTSSLILMGVRLYNPTTGLFTSVDPVPGGNTTEYTYPQDPINKQDLDGNAWKWLKRNWKKVLAVAAVVVVATAVCVYASAACGTAVRAGARVVSTTVRHSIAKAPVVGERGRLFGNYSLGAKKAGYFNNKGRTTRVGWGVNASKGRPYTVFRKYSTRTHAHKDYFRGRYLR
ncbi:DUF6531 domain-containing protein [Changpingibacter yushuensis]|uniref:DUF6531 domain-containing protein n=1 Tax=Changpingibacter yushuensis TaxID=2758440 RepID=UPI0015F5C246|nr:DUF6531 domain-containing protein [Changpingibacter yushuensis]